MQKQRHPPKTSQQSDAPPNGRKAKHVVYPSSDGKPMAETQVHIAELIHCLLVLENRYAADARVYIGADMFLYYEEGNPRAAVAPDLFVVKGVSKLPLRDNYKVWEEGAVPNFVLELTSASTAAEDQRKREVYGRIGVPEYVLYDPRPEEQRPRRSVGGVLQGYRQGAGGYEPMTAAADGGLVSRELGLRLVVSSGRLRWQDIATGVWLLDPRERVAVEAAGRREAENRAATEAEARRDAETRATNAEARLAELEALLRHDPPPPL